MASDISRGDIDVIEVPANNMAEDLENHKCVNMVTLGAFIKKSNLVSLDTLIKGLEETLKRKKRLVGINQQALTAGYELHGT